MSALTAMTVHSSHPNSHSCLFSHILSVLIVKWNILWLRSYSFKAQEMFQLKFDGVHPQHSHISLSPISCSAHPVHPICPVLRLLFCSRKWPFFLTACSSFAFCRSSACALQNRCSQYDHGSR